MKHGDETKIRMSIKAKWRKFTDEHKKKLSDAKKWKPSPRKWYKFTKAELKRHSEIRIWKPSSRKWVKLSKEIKVKISKAKKWKNIWHKSYLPEWYTHSKEVLDKISKAGRKNWTKKSYREKVLGKNQYKKSYQETKLYNIIKKNIPNIKDGCEIIWDGFCRFPDILLEDDKIIIEYDWIRWHKLEDDRKRDKELLELWYVIIHYQWYIPKDKAIIKDILEIKNKKLLYMRKNKDITWYIDIYSSYKEIEDYSN
jgi:hypothetical protein